jgi:hypothetical protein
MDWLESGIFLHADDYARNNGYNNDGRCFLRGPCREGLVKKSLAVSLKGLGAKRK